GVGGVVVEVGVGWGAGLFGRRFRSLRLSCQHANGETRDKLLETPTIVIDRSPLESVESIGETSLDDVQINRQGDDNGNVAARSGAARRSDPYGVWKTIESSLGRVDIPRGVKANIGKESRCERVVRIDGESSQFGTLRIFPQT